METSNDYKEKDEDIEHKIESKGSAIDMILNDLLVFKFDKLINIIMALIGMLCPFVPIIFLFRKDIVIEIGFWQILLITVLANCIVLIWIFLLGLVNKTFKIDMLDLKIKLEYKKIDKINKKAEASFQVYLKKAKEFQESSAQLMEEIKITKENKEYEKTDDIQIKIEKSKIQSFKNNIYALKCKRYNSLVKKKNRKAKEKLNKLDSLYKMNSKSHIFIDSIIYNIILGMFVFGLKGMNYFIEVYPKINVYIKINFTFSKVIAIIIFLYILISIHNIIEIIISVFYTGAFSSKENENNINGENKEVQKYDEKPSLY